jgi:hypothetical protein
MDRRVLAERSGRPADHDPAGLRGRGKLGSVRRAGGDRPVEGDRRVRASAPRAPRTRAGNRGARVDRGRSSGLDRPRRHGPPPPHHRGRGWSCPRPAERPRLPACADRLAHAHGSPDRLRDRPGPARGHDPPFHRGRRRCRDLGNDGERLPHAFRLSASRSGALVGQHAGRRALRAVPDACRNP